ncbi:uncharacterized protein LOC114318579 [Camellia sinensis]|uniref:Transcriptional factor DELLA N-terminal domain-containing protein n=1 Tax=Camellia sinensis var. sinensis TaxID=542762 RepID=A0A4S4D0A2_CAMSN|nr:uncharacterized protein LOC114318579 [Camellia sinensis]THF95610.1 hypothetical protein TEA_016652 [Camellia sinensis var. sinensis]
MGPYDASMSSSGSNSSSSSAGEAPDQIDGLLAGAGYRVRSSELRHVAQRLERLENVMVNAPAEVSTSSLFLLLFIVSLVASNRRPLSLCRPCIVMEAAVVTLTNVGAAANQDKDQSHSDVKLFNRWVFDDIQISDMSVTDYIAVNPVKHATYVPHTAGRYSVKGFMITVSAKPTCFAFSHQLPT